jgi:hypothetical protein
LPNWTQQLTINRRLSESFLIFSDVKPTTPPPSEFGNTWDTREQLRKVLVSGAHAIEDAATFHTFKGAPEAREPFCAGLSTTNTIVPRRVYCDQEIVAINFRRVKHKYGVIGNG